MTKREIEERKKQHQLVAIQEKCITPTRRSGLPVKTTYSWQCSCGAQQADSKTSSSNTTIRDLSLADFIVHQTRRRRKR